MPPHNLTYTAIGAGLLWVGWFGFNAGSAGAADGSAATAFTATHFSAAAGAVVWALLDWLRTGKATLLGASSGLVAGLVCITPAAGHVLPMPALAMGAIAGVVCYIAVAIVKPKLGYDDSLDAFGVHGIGGIIGALLTGVFVSKEISGVDGSLLAQLKGVAVTVIYGFAVSFAILKLIDVTIGLRVSEEQEREGLDISLHGESLE
jgi:Amt family ammonium transporter